MTSNGRVRTGSKNILVLKLSPELLHRFPESSSGNKDNNTTNNNNTTTATSPTSNPTQPSDVNMDTAGANTPVKDREGSPALSLAAADQQMAPSDNASDAASTPAGGGPAGDTPRRKGLPGPKPGSKRSLHPSDAVPKPRAKPGPKKRQKLEDGTAEQQQPKVGAGHRLGPKANTGAINAGLRALDRTGAPCRKWERKPFQLKSFTGILWQLPSWRAPKPPKVDEENSGDGDTKEAVLDPADNDSKANNNDASGVPSEKSNSGDGDLTPAPAPLVEASSPAIPMAG